MNETDEENTPSGPRSPLTEEQIARAIHLYLNTNVPVRVIAEDMNMSVSAFYRLLKKNGVQLRSELKKASRKKTSSKKTSVKRAAKPVAPPAPEPAPNTDQVLRHRDKLIDHLRRCLERQIKEPSASADREKDARTLATLTRTLEKIEELDRQIAPSHEVATEANAPDEKTRTVEDIRAELERRLNRIIAAK